MSLEGRKNDSPTLEKSAIKLEKVPESAAILEKVLFRQRDLANCQVTSLACKYV